MEASCASSVVICQLQTCDLVDPVSIIGICLDGSCTATHDQTLRVGSNSTYGLVRQSHNCETNFLTDLPLTTNPENLRNLIEDYIEMFKTLKSMK